MAADKPIVYQRVRGGPPIKVRRAKPSARLERSKRWKRIDDVQADAKPATTKPKEAAS